MEGEEDNPEVLGVRKFVSARINEIKALTLQLAGDGSLPDKTFAFQHVPKHMRRRAVSHNVKRLPKRLRAAHTAEVGKSQKNKTKPKRKVQSGGSAEAEGGNGEGQDSDEEKPKPKSRKFRRKPSNLLGEYNRRQQHVKWLETHIWHAKRFHMEVKWNYKIPIRPSEKGFRPLYRSFTKGTTMRDISFYSCLQISGERDLICKKLNELTSADVNPVSFSALYYDGGKWEGQMHFYKKGGYPYGYIGPVSFFWKPNASTLWLWVHPAFKEEIVSEIIAQFELTLDPLSIVQSSSTVLTRDEAKLEPKNIGAHKIWKNCSGNIEMKDLEGALNRIRLAGPGTLNLLAKFLKVRTSYKFQDANENSRELKWFEKFFAEKDEYVKTQTHLWESVLASEGISCGAIIPLVVRDPRAFLPQKRESFENIQPSLPEADDENTMDSMDSSTMNPMVFNDLRSDYCHMGQISPLFSEELRETVRLEKMSDMDLAKRRSEMLIPGSEIDLGVEENQIPILLISQDEGIDLIIPAGWAMPFWIGLSYRCVLAHGLRDAIHFAYEDGNIFCPDLIPPDTKWGIEELKALAEATKEEYFKKAPNKRPNLRQLVSPAPFSIDWQLLLSKWTWVPSIYAGPWESVLPPDSPDYFVLRDDKLLKVLERYLSQGIPPIPIPFPDPEKCLVPVQIFMRGKGKPGKDSVICLPFSCDVGTSDAIKEFNYKEPPVRDRTIKKTKALRAKHVKLMAFLRKKRKKNKGKECSSIYGSTEPSRLYNEQLRALWTPDHTQAFKLSTRHVFGFITIGGECYSMGKCAYMGYVSLLGLTYYMKKRHSKIKGFHPGLPKFSTPYNHVLVRDTRVTLKYRLAHIEIMRAL